MERKNVAPEVAMPRSPYGDGVLHREHEHLHDQAQTQAEDEHVQRAHASAWSRPTSR